jgi:hypothetical protein
VLGEADGVDIQLHNLHLLQLRLKMLTWMEVQSKSVEWVIQQLVGWVIEIIGGVASVGAGKDERLGDKATK